MTADLLRLSWVLIKIKYRRWRLHRLDRKMDRIELRHTNSGRVAE